MTHNETESEGGCWLSEDDAHLTAWMLGEYAAWLAIFPYTYNRAMHIAGKLDADMELWGRRTAPDHEARADMIAEQIVRLCVQGAGESDDAPAYLDRIAAAVAAAAQTHRDGPRTE